MCIRDRPDAKNPQYGADSASEDRQHVIEEVRSKLAELGNDELVGVFEGALVGANQMVFRERAKTSLVRVLHESRMAIRELGKRHAESGTVSDPEHIFMLLDEELDSFVADPSGYNELLYDRYENWLKLWRLTPPFFLRDGIIPPLTEWGTSTSTVESSLTEGAVLAGTAGCPGVVTGRARIVRDPTAPPDLEPGDIMAVSYTHLTLPTKA